MTHADRFHGQMDEAFALALAKDKERDQRYREALSRDGGRFEDVPPRERESEQEVPPYRGTLLPSRQRMRDLRSLAMNEPRQAKVLFAKLIECTSARGTKYLRGHAGANNLVAFRGVDDDQGRPTWELFLAERMQKPGVVSDDRRLRQERTSAAIASGVDLDDSIPF
jgi:hypothetical protein